MSLPLCIGFLLPHASYLGETQIRVLSTHTHTHTHIYKLTKEVHICIWHHNHYLAIGEEVACLGCIFFSLHPLFVHYETRI